MPSACSAPNKGLSPSPARACLRGLLGVRGASPRLRLGEFGGVPVPVATVVGGAARHKDGDRARYKDGGRRRARRALPNTKMAAREALWLRASAGSYALTSSLCDAVGPRGSWMGRTGGPRDRDRDREPPPRGLAGPPRLRPRLGGGGKASRSGRRRWWPSRGASPSRDGCGRIPGRRGGKRGGDLGGSGLQKDCLRGREVWGNFEGDRIV